MLIVTYSSKRLQHLKQSINLTGFGTPEFDTYISKIDEIHRLFSRNLPANTLHPWSPDVFNEHPAIAISNRLFTNRHDQGTEPDLLFSPKVDSRGILERCKGQTLVHLPENRVDFYQLTSGTSDPQCVFCFHSTSSKLRMTCFRYKQIDPVKFRNGDIVEAQLSFNCIKTKDQHRLLVVLRALTLLNDQYVTVCAFLLLARHCYDMIFRTPVLLPAEHFHKESREVLLFSSVKWGMV